MSEEESVRKALKSLGRSGLHSLTKRTIEERVADLGCAPTSLSRAELMDLAADVAKELEVEQEMDSPEKKKQKKEEKEKKKKKQKKEEEEEEEEKKKEKKKSAPSASSSRRKSSAKDDENDEKTKKKDSIDWDARAADALAVQHKSGWTLERFEVLAAAAARPQLFCRRCGSLLPAPEDTSKKHLACVVCKHATPVANVAGRQSVSRWTPMLVSKVKKGNTERSTIAMSCENPQCDATIVEYYQMQLRSADEGSTTFYECKKCGHKWNENN